MVKHQQQMFTTPAPLKELYKRNMSHVQRGMCPPISSKVCQQISVAEYRQQKRAMTNQSLSELMNFIINNLHMSLKEKEERLKLFQKHHNDVFIQQFPNGQFWETSKLPFWSSVGDCDQVWLTNKYTLNYIYSAFTIIFLCALLHAIFTLTYQVSFDVFKVFENFWFIPIKM